MTATEQKIRELLALVLDTSIPNGQPVSRDSEPKWNSLKHVELIFALEDAFDIRFTENEMAELNSIAAIAAVIDRQRGAA